MVQPSCVDAALKLHTYLDHHHVNDAALIGPDPGIRVNYRLGRFVKSYLPHIDWRDDYYYLQAQGYWTLANWRLYTQTGASHYSDLALGCARHMLTRQRPDGAWEYPNPEWQGRVATNEGTWAALGLLESYRHAADRSFLQGALRWHTFLTDVIGYQTLGDELAINYFAHQGGTRIPNNSITVLRFLAELSDVTGESRYMAPGPGLLTFLQHVQQPSGEFPYAVAQTTRRCVRAHFQCYQYNAFECLNLMRYHDLTGDATGLAMLVKQLRFVAQGLTAAGYARYQCGSQRRTVTYHTAACGAAFSKANRMGISGYAGCASRAFAYVLNLQRADGSFLHSQRDYGLLTDRRSYPRYLAMMVYHLLQVTDTVGVGHEVSQPHDRRQ